MTPSYVSAEGSLFFESCQCPPPVNFALGKHPCTGEGLRSARTSKGWDESRGIFMGPCKTLSSGVPGLC